MSFEFCKIFSVKSRLTNPNFCNTMYYKKDVVYMTISLRLSNEDFLLIKKYAELKKMSVSELMRQSVMERIEDEYDLKAYQKAMENFRKDPTTYSLDEVERELGLK